MFNKLKCLFNHHDYPVIIAVNTNNGRVLQRCRICNRYQFFDIREGIVYKSNWMKIPKGKSLNRNWIMIEELEEM